MQALEYLKIYADETNVVEEEILEARAHTSLKRNANSGGHFYGSMPMCLDRGARTPRNTYAY